MLCGYKYFVYRNANKTHKMKNLILIPILGVICLIGFFAFTSVEAEDFQAKLVQSDLKIQDSFALIARQNECIDDLESSLYDFSTEINSLRAENEFLVGENEDLKRELKSYAKMTADLRSELTALEIKNYNEKRKLEQLLKGRAIRERLQSNSPIAANNALIPSPDSDEMSSIQIEEVKDIAETQTKIEDIQTALIQRAEALDKIQKSTEEAFASIQNNEAKIQLNIDVEPMSNPTIDLNDPLVSQSVLYTESVDHPKLFSQLEMVEDESIAALEGTEDEFSSKSPIYSLLENTNVIYNYIACRNDRYGRKIKKLKTSAKNWRYTFLQFNLEADNTHALLDKQFRMRVLSTDLNNYLHFTTDKSTESSSYYDFVYDGEPVKISFYNEKNIKGKSFDIQIFHIVDNEEYLLENHQKTLFDNGLDAL